MKTVTTTGQGSVQNDDKVQARVLADLDRRYGAIGIDAVAAAARYAGSAKTPAHMLPSSQIDPRFIERAADRIR